METRTGNRLCAFFGCYRIVIDERDGPCYYYAIRYIARQNKR
jgi:hypothetical protein